MTAIKALKRATNKRTFVTSAMWVVGLFILSCGLVCYGFNWNESLFFGFSVWLMGFAYYFDRRIGEEFNKIQNEENHDQI